MNGRVQNTHENYVIGFTDGTVKIGTTSRGTKRVTEVVNRKIGSNPLVGVVSYYISELRSRDEAFRVERDTCYLLRKHAVKNTREWISTKQTGNENIRLFADNVKQTLEMFGHGIGLDRGK